MSGQSFGRLSSVLRKLVLALLTLFASCTLALQSFSSEMDVAEKQRNDLTVPKQADTGGRIYTMNRRAAAVHEGRGGSTRD